MGKYVVFAVMTKNTIRCFLIIYSIFCIGGFSIVYSQNKPLPVVQLVDTSVCSSLRVWLNVRLAPQDKQGNRQLYDSLKMYVENCAAIDAESFRAFWQMHDAAIEMSPKNLSSLDTFRDWCISVLYLNTTNPNYFCNCLGAISGTYGIGTEYFSKFPYAYGAVHNYFNKYHPECLGSDDSATYARDSSSARSDGIDPTILPPLDSIGLGILLTHQGVSSPSTQSSNHFLTSFTSSPNPFFKEATLKFALNRMSYVTLAVYDGLGRLVWGDGKGSSLEAGVHRIQLNGGSFPTGTLYARISTAFGEVKTVKLIHQ